jgi:pimeloyl-ACP methyl ester carboxylesterase
MGTVTTTDGTEIFYKDWGSGQPIVFSHGWPLSADDWDTPWATGTGSSLMTGAGTAAPPRPAAVMIWTTTPTTWPP